MGQIGSLLDKKQEDEATKATLWERVTELEALVGH